MIRKKNKKHFERQLYYRFADYMYTVCYRYIGNKEEAEEILNNGFIKVFDNYSKFEERGENSLKGWIKKIMINECLMFLRKRNALELSQIENLQETIYSFTPNYGSESLIMEIIKQLPVGYRTVFNLYAIEGYTHAEIAQKLNIKESTSRSQLTMARKILKEQLKSIGYETVEQ